MCDIDDLYAVGFPSINTLISTLHTLSSTIFIPLVCLLVHVHPQYKNQERQTAICAMTGVFVFLFSNSTRKF